MFHHKYLKYKNKYLNLLYKMKGGAAASEKQWKCLACTFQNSDFLQKCEICQTPRPVAMAVARVEPRPAPIQPKKVETWLCKICTLENLKDLKMCEACNTPKIIDEPVPVKLHQPQPKKEETWLCKICTFANHKDLPICEGCFSSKTAQTPTKLQLDELASVKLHKPQPFAHEQPSKIFYLYTTGIGDWHEPTLINEWIKSVRKTILANIHKDFTKIVIRHYDPLVEDPKNEAISEAFKREHIERLLADDKKHGLNSEFIEDYINLKELEELGKPHLLLDFAHILSYLPNKQTSDGKKTYNNINSLYFGYLGDLKTQIISKQKLFNMDKYGNTETYIDKLIKLTKEPITDPIDIIRNIIKAIIKKNKQELERAFILKGGLKDKLLVDNLDTNPDYYVIVINAIMNDNFDLDKILYEKILLDIKKI